MNVIQKTICAGLALTCMACGAPLWAGENERDAALQINKANELLRDGDVESALGAYQAAGEFAPESADLSYNMAVAQYRKGDVAAAERLFQSAATSENDTLAARARYNLGNCRYASALQLAEKDRPAAIERLETAITNYRTALDVDSTDADARANIELATELIEKLREEQKQQEQRQNQQEQNQEQNQENQQQDQQQQDQHEQQQENEQEKDQQQQDDEQQQQSQSSQGDENQKDQSAQSNSQQDDKKSQEEQSQNEQSPQDETESKPQDQKDAANKDEQQQSPPEEQSQDDQPQRPQSQSEQRQQQQVANKQSPPKEPTPSPEADDKQGKQPPQGELTAAGEEDARSDQKNQQEVAAFDPSKDGEMTQQEAEKMLQAIRDRDMMRRLRRQAVERSQHVPVDRDW